MYRPSLKSLWTIVSLAILSAILFYWTDHSKVDKKTRWYNEKIEASKKMYKYMDVLKKEAHKRGYNIDKTNDPFLSGLIGPDITSITTSIGVLSEKITALNPNLAAAFVDMIKSAGLTKGDHIAVGLTGANPGANLAMYAAIKTLELKPIIITSVGSSKYGATREDFTWLDMESILYNNKLINFKSTYASLGGGKDIGRGLSKEGRENIIKAIERNNCVLINEPSLEENISKRREAYINGFNSLNDYKLFINIGAGVANVGSLVNAKLIKNGINTKLGDQNFENPGIFYDFAQKNIPILHVYSVRKIAEKYELPIEPETMPEVGKGSVFSKKITNVIVAYISLAILVLAIIAVIVFDRKDRHFLENIIDS